MEAEPPFLLAIDQGTTSTRAILFDSGMRPLASHAVELRQIYPANGWVEHDPEEIWRAVLVCCRVAAKGVSPTEIVAIGIANQRETTVLWERASGRALHNAIVWQDRRTADRCHALVSRGEEAGITARTGLVIDPYFSATKLEWLLDNIPDARQRADELAFGTIDSWLVFRLTGGQVHATDVTNASRTMLFNLAARDWNENLLALFRVPREVLPEIRDSAGDFGETLPDLLGARIPIRGVAGDQQAAAFGQACFNSGDVKATYGTGCFALVNTGPVVPVSHNRLLATAACSVGGGGGGNYAIEGSIFVAGGVVQWLRDALGVIRSAGEIERLAHTARETTGLYFVPAFTGLGAPYWDSEARGAILGLTRDTGAAEIARAALDAVCYQTRDLLDAMARDMTEAGLGAPQVLRIDGGMVANDSFCQRLADLCGREALRPSMMETTALGAAYLAGLGSGLFRNLDEIRMAWTAERSFEPRLESAARDALYDGWKNAVGRVRSRQGA